MFNDIERVIMEVATPEKRATGELYPPLETLTRTHITTAEAAFYLNRRPQTLRGWACTETWPDGLRPTRVNGRLDWPVAGIRRLRGM